MKINKNLNLFQKESDIQSAIIDYLEFLQSQGKLIFWRNNTGAAKYTYTSKKTGVTSNRFIRYGVPGISDIIGTVNGGKSFYIEVKRPGNKPTNDQKIFLDNVKKLGALAIVAYSLDDVIKEIK